MRRMRPQAITRRGFLVIGTTVAGILGGGKAALPAPKDSGTGGGPNGTTPAGWRKARDMTIPGNYRARRFSAR